MGSSRKVLPVFSQADDEYEPGSGTAVISKAKPELKEPSMYRVLLHNDDFTPMDFVIDVLRSFFGKGPEESNQIMLEVHNSGIGRCGIYPREIAETKAVLVSEKARENQYPLKCTFEKEVG